MKQLAELAGLDVSTVSRALRGDKRRVASTTINRVMELARETGYRPDPVAASLRNGQSKLIGVLIPSLDDIVLGILVTAIDQAAREHGYLSTVIATHDDLDTRPEVIDRLLGRRVDGLILCDSTIGEEEVPQLSSGSRRGTASIPAVYAMRRSNSHPSVSADDFAGGALVARHLIDAGHQDLALVPGPPNARTAVDRAEGFLETIRSESAATVQLPPDGAGGFAVADGHRAVTALLDAGAHPTAVFCTNDHTAIGAGRALQEHGLRVGRDVALVGYNDIPLAAYLEPPLSSVRTDVNAMGRLAFLNLITQIEGGEMPSRLLEPSLVVRESSLLPM